MGMFARLADLWTANINALLDRVEDPERMLAQVIREMEAGLSGARHQAATAVAAGRRLSRELEQSRAEVSYWKEHARLALNSGREDLARQALAHKIEHGDLARVLENQSAAAQETTGEIMSALHTLESKLAEARRKQRTLLARQRAATVRLEAQRSLSASVPDVETPSIRFTRFEEKLAELEDHLLAQVEVNHSAARLEADLAGLEMKKRIEEELNALKREEKG